MAIDLRTIARPRVCYIEIPAADPQTSARFYETVFGWNIRHRDSDRPSFDDASEIISGAFVRGRNASTEPGVMVHIWVDGIREIAARIEAHGGALIEQLHPDEPGSSALTAIFRDPAGNLLGIYEEDAV